MLIRKDLLDLLKRENFFSSSSIKFNNFISGRCPKLSPRFCEPWTIVTKPSDVAYSLELPPGCRFIRCFMLVDSRDISKDDNLIDGLISLQEDDSVDHDPYKILDWREKRLHNLIL